MSRVKPLDVNRHSALFCPASGASGMQNWFPVPPSKPRRGVTQKESRLESLELPADLVKCYDEVTRGARKMVAPSAFAGPVH